MMDKIAVVVRYVSPPLCARHVPWQGSLPKLQEHHRASARHPQPAAAYHVCPGTGLSNGLRPTGSGRCGRSSGGAAHRLHRAPAPARLAPAHGGAAARAWCARLCRSSRSTGTSAPGACTWQTRRASCAHAIPPRPARRVGALSAGARLHRRLQGRRGWAGRIYWILA